MVNELAPKKASELIVTFFPGCSLSTTARESNDALLASTGPLSFQVVVLEDWNCCGSSSGHAIDPDLAITLGARNLSLADPDLPLMAACPNCYKNLRSAAHELKRRPRLHQSLQDAWGRAIPLDLEIDSFLEILRFLRRIKKLRGNDKGLVRRPFNGLKVAPYYGCMLMEPRWMRRSWSGRGVMEGALRHLGAEVIDWSGKHRCCGTFLSAAKPDAARRVVDSIMDSAITEGAECLMTACAMCQVNLEIRCSMKNPLPTLHFSEVLAMVLNDTHKEGWFKRHIVDPRPALARRGLINV